MRNRGRRSRFNDRLVAATFGITVLALGHVGAANALVLVEDTFAPRVPIPIGAGGLNPIAFYHDVTDHPAFAAGGFQPGIDVPVDAVGAADHRPRVEITLADDDAGVFEVLAVFLDLDFRSPTIVSTFDILRGVGPVEGNAASLADGRLLVVMFLPPVLRVPNDALFVSSTLYAAFEHVPRSRARQNVPEPGTLGLVGGSMLLAGAAATRRRRNASTA